MMSVKKKKSKKVKGFNYPDRILSVDRKKEIVKEIIQKDYSCREACDKFKATPATILRWCRLYAPKSFEKMKERPRQSESTKRQAVREIEAGLLTVEEALIKYKIKKASTILQWCTKYTTPDVNTVMEEKELRVDNSETAALKRALEQAHLKINGLETMIDIAEVEFNIDIRKKSGTKQSNS